ncbi:hypothetical protein M8828_05730 [Aeromonas simiae]|uniref:hypothetical protein n=1 Tax=Aeromonas simiae TaxID=218936 RepID=UPI00266DCD44|nr:hypothetical protein [Aeromonas simiae]MDO2947928.1 hypothetical protein [Aeromonas simiae]MDO2955311.1 hypothetical protein [Aeromonas simiae]
MMVRFIILFLIIFDIAFPPVKAVGSAVFALVAMAPMLYSYNVSQKLFNYVKILQLPLLIVFSVILFSLFITIISTELELTFTLSICKTLIILFSCLLYISVFETNRLSHDLINVFFVNAVICFVAGSVPSLLEFVYIFKPDNSLLSWIPYRNAFLAGSGFFGISTAYGLVFFLICYLIKEEKQPLMFYLKSLTIILAGVIAGRTAMLGLAFGGLLFLLDIKKMIAFLIVIIISIGLFLSIDALSIYSHWVFELINSEGGGTESTNILFSMYDSEFSTSQLLVGDGLYDNYYMNVDAGYLRHLYFGGIFLVILSIFFPIALALSSKNRLFMLFIVPICLLYHFKGAFIFHSRIGMPTLFMLCIIFQQNNARNKS